MEPNQSVSFDKIVSEIRIALAEAWVAHNPAQQANDNLSATFAALEGVDQALVVIGASRIGMAPVVSRHEDEGTTTFRFPFQEALSSACAEAKAAIERVADDFPSDQFSAIISGAVSLLDAIGSGQQVDEVGAEYEKFREHLRLGGMTPSFNPKAVAAGPPQSRISVGAQELIRAWRASRQPSGRIGGLT